MNEAMAATPVAVRLRPDSARGRAGKAGATEHLGIRPKQYLKPGPQSRIPVIVFASA